LCPKYLKKLISYIGVGEIVIFRSGVASTTGDVIGGVGIDVG